MAVTPGWECVPVTAGQAVLSGGTGAAPSCAAGTTAVLAPTYVASGVGGKPTVQFNAVNVQIISGSGSTSGTVNGEGNLIVGYAEDTTGHAQTGSNNLVVGSENGWKSFGEIVGGFENQAGSKYATAFGFNNSAQGAYSLVAGMRNKATGSAASAIGGTQNTASGAESSVTGGQLNLAFDPVASVVGGCDNEAGLGALLSGTCATSGAEAVLGGFRNSAFGLNSTVSGGESNSSAGTGTSILGGDGEAASANCQSIPASPGTC